MKTYNNSNIVNKRFKEAIYALHRFLFKEVKDIPTCQYSLVDKTTNNFEKFKEDIATTGVYLITKEGLHNSMYGVDYYNLLARVWHDRIHFTQDLDFSLSSEIEVAGIMVKEFKHFAFNNNEYAEPEGNYMPSFIPEQVIKDVETLINIDVVGQTIEYRKTKVFVKDQFNFVYGIFHNCITNRKDNG